MDFRPVEEGEERSDSEGSHNEEAKDHEKTAKKEGEKTDRVVAGKGGFSCICSMLQCRVFVNSVTQNHAMLQKQRKKQSKHLHRLPGQIPHQNPSLQTCYRQAFLKGRKSLCQKEQTKQKRRRIEQRIHRQPKCPTEGKVINLMDKFNKFSLLAVIGLGFLKEARTRLW